MITVIGFTFWSLFSIAVFAARDSHNAKCKYKLLMVTWEPWVISFGALVVVIPITT